MPKRKRDDEDPSIRDLMKRIKKLDKKLKRKKRHSRSKSRHASSSRSAPQSTTCTPSSSPSPLDLRKPEKSQPPPPPPPPPTPPPPPPPPPTPPTPTPTPQLPTTQLESTPAASQAEEPLPEEFLLALGHEGEQQDDTGAAITNELAVRWSKIMTEGLTKEQREALVVKYNTPKNFMAANAPILNKEIAATLSEISINRDKRIIARQNLTGKLMCCLGKTLSEILKGNINNKKIIEEINDAAKIAAEIYFTDNKSRKFFALSNASKPIQEACKDAKTDKYLFSEGLAEQIKAVQTVKRTAAQIKITENQKPTTTKPLNWKSPSQYQTTSFRGRGGQRPARRLPTNQPPRRPAPARGSTKFTPQRTNHRRY